MRKLRIALSAATTTVTGHRRTCNVWRSWMPSRTQGPPRAQLDTKGTRLRDTVTSTFAGVGAAMVMLIVFVIMMLVFCVFWALGTWIRLDETRR
jgi:hypothetical protein